ncbi:MAG: helix-turn-helix domain-containing protein [Clostridia bacterium]|nr:helix-turn-helix domain-containing protein [Clostridia bacterium]
MDSELNLLLKGIKEKTGIDIVVFSDGMKYSASTTPMREILAPSTKNFNGVYQDALNGNTYFKVKYRNAGLIGYIRGVSVVEKNYAFLVSELIENASGTELALSKPEYLKSVLLGECNHTQIQNFERKYSTPNKSCFVLVISINTMRRSEIADVLTSFGEDDGDIFTLMDDTHFAYVKFATDDANDYQSANDFASFLAQSVKEETGASVNIGVGGSVKSIFEVSNSYQQALMAVRMSAIMNSRGEIHSFKEYVLLKMLEDLPKLKLSESLEVLLDENAREIFTDTEMILTAEEFLENSLNISETSRKLYLHRNTLMYRLDKIERETGLNIRKFSDAVTFRLVTMLFKLIK